MPVGWTINLEKCVFFFFFSENSTEEGARMHWLIPLEDSKHPIDTLKAWRSIWASRLTWQCISIPFYLIINLLCPFKSYLLTSMKLTTTLRARFGKCWCQKTIEWMFQRSRFRSILTLWSVQNNNLTTVRIVQGGSKMSISRKTCHFTG